MGFEIPATFELDTVKVSGETFKFVGHCFSNSGFSCHGRDAKVGDGCKAIRNAIKEIAEYLILAVRGDKQRAFDDSFLERPKWHKAEIAGILAIECERFIAPILSR